MVLSHSEKQIVEGCIALMQELTESFEEWLDWLDINPGDGYEEQRFCYNMSYFKIVQRLLLYHTNHSGGTSTREKCRELGFDSSEQIEFADRREMDGGE